MIVTSPALTAFTVPFSSTVAIVSSLDLYVTFATLGQTLAVSFVSDPTTTSVGAVTLSPAFTTLAVAVSFLETFLPDFLAVTVTVIGGYLDPFFIGYQFTEMLYLCRFLRITLIKKSA